jgi:polyisoprenoid-binding protein YceI
MEAPNDSYDIDSGASSVRFEAANFKFKTVPGVFHDLSGVVRFDEDDLSTLEAEAQIDAASIDTGIEQRDDHLRTADFMEVETYPQITFESRAVRNVRGRDFELEGTLTLHGTERPVALQAHYEGRDAGSARFTARTAINRLDYDVKWYPLLEAGGFIVGHEIKIYLDVVAQVE